MNEPPPNYTGRRDLIAEKLEPYLNISAMLPKDTTHLGDGRRILGQFAVV